MKALVLVDGIASLPASMRGSLLVVTAANWSDSVEYLQGKTAPVRLFLHDSAPFQRMLKAVEDYQGDLAVYTAALEYDAVMTSRFTKVVNRRKESLRDFSPFTKIENDFKELAGLL